MIGNVGGELSELDSTLAITEIHAWTGAQVGWTGPARIAKRAIDVGLSLCGLVVLSPVLVLVAILVKLTSRGPVLFKQSRIGRGRTHIRVFKFRTMFAKDCDPVGILQSFRGDPRITPLGRVLRRYSIDELPQLWNVVRGDMSLVGPRAHATKMLVCGEPYEALVGDYHLRHQVRPGITGLAQVRGLRGPVLDFSHARRRFAADLEYIRRFSVGFDLLILARTILVELWTEPERLEPVAANCLEHLAAE